MNSTQQQLLTVTAGKESAESELILSQLEKEKCAVVAEKMVYFYFRERNFRIFVGIGTKIP